MAKDSPTRSTRFGEDLDDDFEKFRDANDMTNSEALRTLVRTGMEEVRSDPLDDRPGGLLAGLLWDARRDFHTFVLVALVALLLSTLTAPPVSWVFSGVAFLYSLSVAVGAIDKFLNSKFSRALAGVDRQAGDEVEA